MADISGVQAQDSVAEVLSVRVRTNGLTALSVDEARTQDRSVVRIWAMRGTLHLVASEDVRWMLALLGPAIIRKSRRRLGELGLAGEAGAKAVAALRNALESHGPMSRAEIVDRLSGKGIPVEGQRAYHLVRRAALEGVVCLGPDAGGESTYDLLDRWLSPSPGVDDPSLSLPAGTSAHTAPPDPTTSPRGLAFLAGIRGLRSKALTES